jgi:hypothetical protein
MRISRTLVVLFIAMWLALQAATASTIYFTFQIVDDTGVGVAGATLTQTELKLLSSGAAIGAVTVTPVDLADGDYSIGYDPEANGEAIVKFSVSATGHTFTGRNGLVSVVMVRDSSRLLNGITSTGNTTPGGYATGQDPATLVLGATAATWNTAGTIGNKINTGGSGGNSDPFSNLFLPGIGAYAANTWGGHFTAFLAGSPSGWLTGDTASVNAIVNGIFAHQVEATVTLQQALEIIAAYCGGNVNTGAHTYSGIGVPATVRMTYIIDAFGNRNFTLSP